MDIKRQKTQLELPFGPEGGAFLYPDLSLSLELLGRGQLVPVLGDKDGAVRTGWQLVLARPEDRQRFQGSSHALPIAVVPLDSA